MKIEPKSVKVKDIYDGYIDSCDDGVFAYDGKLAIRPAYQREFVYDADQAEPSSIRFLRDSHLTSCTGFGSEMTNMKYLTGNKGHCLSCSF